MLVSAYWPDNTSNKEVDTVVRGLFSKLEEVAQERSLLQPFQYLNYAAEFQQPLDSYKMPWRHFLERVNSVYDSRGVMQHQLPGGFKTSDF
jgi:hypothetical protein